jgi:hypothetical protein
MDSIKIILLSGLAFNLGLVLLLIYLVKRAKAKQKDQTMFRRQQMLEQGKIITAQEMLLKGKQQLLQEKEKLLEVYRKYTPPE